MLAKLVTVLTHNAKLALAAVAGAAVVAGGSAVAIQQVANSTPTTTTTVTAPVKGGEHASDRGVEQRSDTATAGIKPNPGKHGKPDKVKGCTHGAAVSAAAHDPSTQGREHGKAVSTVARDKSACALKTDRPTGQQDAEQNSTSEPTDAGKSDAGHQRSERAKSGSATTGSEQSGKHGSGRPSGTPGAGRG